MKCATLLLLLQRSVWLLHPQLCPLPKAISPSCGQELSHRLAQAQQDTTAIKVGIEGLSPAFCQVEKCVILRWPCLIILSWVRVLVSTQVHSSWSQHLVRLVKLLLKDIPSSGATFAKCGWLERYLATNTASAFATMTMTHSKKSIQQSSVAWPYRPREKESVRTGAACAIGTHGETRGK